MRQRFLYLLMVLFLTTSFFGHEDIWLEAKGVITEITVHQGKRKRETALVQFIDKEGNEQLGAVELIRYPILGSMKAVGDTLVIKYMENDPTQVETLAGSWISKYGMWVLIAAGVVLSIKQLVFKKNQRNAT